MAVRLFVGNMPYGATEADLRAHFSGVGPPSQIVIPGRPRNRTAARIRVRRIPRARRSPRRRSTGSTSSPSWAARSRSARPGRARRAALVAASGQPAVRAASAVRGLAASGVARLVRRRLQRSAARWRLRRPPAGGFGGPSSGAPGVPGKNFGPPKKKSDSSEKRWENKERGPKGPIKERYTGRLGGLYDDPKDENVTLTDFDDSGDSSRGRGRRSRTQQAAHGDTRQGHRRPVPASFGAAFLALGVLRAAPDDVLAGVVGATRRRTCRRRRGDPRVHRRRAERLHGAASRFPASRAGSGCSS